MTPVIEQTHSFAKVSPADLYELFMDAAKHSAATGMPAKVSRKVGGKWSAFGGMILGKNLALVPNRMIVQAWRSSAWKKADSDSVLVIRFEKTRGGATAYLAHVGVPAHDHKGVTKGWKKYYWEPWKEYLKTRKRPASG
jgi:activator of HSP90 ATPase